jgi:CheY-like chemotaxis protein
MSTKPTILYAEDDPNDAVVFERALKKSGLPFDLQIAPDGQFAVDYLKGEDQYHDRKKYPLPQIVVTDMKMYRMSGVELLEWIRASAKFRDLPVVLYSTSNEEIDVSHAATAGATAYFRKTYQCAEVIAFLQNWLAQKSAAKNVAAIAATRRRPRSARADVSTEALKIRPIAKPSPRPRQKSP